MQYKGLSPEGSLFCLKTIYCAIFSYLLDHLLTAYYVTLLIKSFIVTFILPLLSKRKRNIIKQAVNVWRSKYRAYVNFLIKTDILFKDDIGKKIPSINLLQAKVCNTKGAFWYRFIFINEKEPPKSDDLGQTIFYPLRYFWTVFELDFIEIIMNKTVNFNLSKSSKYDNSIYYHTVINHEIGHALGLVHYKGTSDPLMHWNAWHCRGKICMPSEKDLENFLNLYVNLQDRREYKERRQRSDIVRRESWKMQMETCGTIILSQSHRIPCP